MSEKIRIGISSCLLGNNVRYDGGHKQAYYLTETLDKYVEWIPVCPEVEYGLPVPREQMRLEGDPKAPRLVTIKTGTDHTDGMLKWARSRLKELERDNLCGFIFKSRSPSSGYKGVKVYSPTGLRRGKGIFTSAFIRHLPVLPIEDEVILQDPGIRENFIGRVIVMNRWKEFLAKNNKKSGLVSFHTDHELLLMSHSPRHYTLLGRMVANLKDYNKKELFDRYIRLFMEGQRLIATAKKNQNVLSHVLEYFNKHLTVDEKAKLNKTIENYYKGLSPLIVPVTLINHYVSKFNEPYLKRQCYLDQYPIELMLRAHL